MMTSTIDRPARVGVITDQTGALSLMGIANVNVARMVIDDINSKGGLLGRPVELFIEDSATDDDVAQAAAARLANADVDVVVGGIYSSTRQAIKVPVVDEAGKLYLYPEQYEGQECHPLTGPVPAQQIEPFFPWLMRETGATTFYLPSADYIWPHTLNKKVREVVAAPGRTDSRRAVLPARSRRLQGRGGRHHGDRSRCRVQHDRAARSDTVPGPAARRRVHGARWAGGVHLLRRELPEPGAG
jgi:ABC-type branched-subunit amino acid transport system substrate-binding protein